MKRLLFLFAAILAAPAGVGGIAEAPRIAIIIDDLGYQLAAGRRAIALPGAVSFAILPHAPRATVLARAANAAGKEVLVHLPMQAAIDDPGDSPGVTLDMSREQFRNAIARAIDSVPFAIGLNNHRGSLVTRHPGHMRWLMEELGLREQLFFVDSYTTHHSVALQVAAESGVRAIKRDVFLDTSPEPAAIRAEFERLKAIARKRGAAVAIGHPHEATLAFLESELPKLAAEGYELVPISALVAN